MRGLLQAYLRRLKQGLADARGEFSTFRAVSVLRAADDGTVIVCADGDDGLDNVGVNREFLLDALAAAARDALVLELGAPTAPLAIRRPDAERAFSLLMPVRLED